MKAVGYVRVSTNKDEQELSLENQTEFSSKYIVNRGDELVAIYSDKGKSATKMKNRKELQRMLKAAERGDFQKLYVKDISRLFRNTLDFITVSRQLSERGIQLHLVNMGEGKDIDAFTLNLMAMLAENESQKMSERIKFSKKISQEKGIVPNFVFGYDRQDKYTLVPNPEESQWVREIFRLYTEERLGMARIAKMLYEQRVKTRKLQNGEPNYNWSQTAVSRLLRNQIYIGKVINGRQSKKNIYTDERIDNPKESWLITERPEFRIVSDETFYKAQDTMKLNADKYLTTAFGTNDKAVRRSDKHLFSNIIKCGSCGFSYRRTQRKGADSEALGAYWTCSKRAAYGTERCETEYIRIEEKWLTEAALQLLARLVDDKDSFYKAVSEKCEAVARKYIKETEGFDIKDAGVDLADLKSRRERIKSMAVRGLITLDEAERDIVPINAEIERLGFALNKTDKTRALTEVVRASARQFFSAFEDVGFSKTLDNDALKRIIKEIRVINKQLLEVYFNVGGDTDGLPFPLSMTYQTDIDTDSSDRTCGRSVTLGDLLLKPELQAEILDDYFRSMGFYDKVLAAPAFRKEVSEITKTQKTYHNAIDSARLIRNGKNPNISTDALRGVQELLRDNGISLITTSKYNLPPIDRNALLERNAVFDEVPIH